MGLLNKTRVYLCGPMEFATDGRGWRNVVKSDLKDLGIICFDPFDKPCMDSIEECESKTLEWRTLLNEGRFDEAEKWAKRVRSEDLRYCDIVDFAIAYIDKTIPTFGTVEELSWLVRCKKPIFLVVEGGKKACPLWIFGMIPHKYIYNSVEDALKIIKKIDDGEIVPDSSRWRLLKPSFR